ncbi:DUF421 domain-containing protein [Salinisphaera aquimarina]|uniref:DUF421 domain-containing protein n=1 Tax=Salinisphaera aquimarina TaxID=2094031 RepID=A0ABV7ESC8_9GAMM
MNWNWIAASGSSLIMVLISGLGIYIALMLFTRIAGLRSFSKMSSFDFAITIAFGSVIASTLMAESPPLATGVFALAVLYTIQYAVSRARRASPLVERVVDNEPLVVMVGPDVLSANLDEARMTLGDLKSKLRMAGVTHRDQVLVVVMESTGDVSVLKRVDRVDPWLFDQVRGAETLLAEIDATPA